VLLLRPLCEAAVVHQPTTGVGACGRCLSNSFRIDVRRSSVHQHWEYQESHCVCQSSRLYLVRYTDDESMGRIIRKWIRAHLKSVFVNFCNSNNPESERWLSGKTRPRRFNELCELNGHLIVILPVRHAGRSVHPIARNCRGMETSKQLIFRIDSNHPGGSVYSDRTMFSC
jgi:hypothetical protein